MQIATKLRYFEFRLNTALLSGISNCFVSLIVDQFRVLVIGAGGLGVWALKIAEFVMRDSELAKDRVHITVADTSVDAEPL